MHCECLNNQTDCDLLPDISIEWIIPKITEYEPGYFGQMVGLEFQYQVLDH